MYKLNKLIIKLTAQLNVLNFPLKNFDFRLEFVFIFRVDAGGFHFVFHRSYNSRTSLLTFQLLFSARIYILLCNGLQIFTEHRYGVLVLLLQTSPLGGFHLKLEVIQHAVYWRVFGGQRFRFDLVEHWRS